MKADIGFVASLTEFEAGWGQRPDGYILADSLEDGKKTQKEIESQGSYECFVRAGEFQQVFLTEDGVKLLNSDKVHLISRKDIYLYIKKPA